MSLLQALNLPAPPATASKGGPAVGKSSASDKAKAAADGKAADRDAAKLLDAAASWRRTHAQCNEQIASLKQGVKDHCADAHPELLKEIEKGLATLDGVLDGIDHRLAEALADAAAATDEKGRQNALKSAKAILGEYVAYVKGEPLIAHMDSNPFSVKTGIKALILSGLSTAAKAIG